MDSRGEAGTPLVFDITQRCRDALRDCTLTDKLMEGQWAENRLADFNLWAASVGASTHGPACLDSRLVGDALTHGVVISLLLNLGLHVDECLRLGKFLRLVNRMGGSLIILLKVQVSTKRLPLRVARLHWDQEKRNVQKTSGTACLSKRRWAARRSYLTSLFEWESQSDGRVGNPASGMLIGHSTPMITLTCGTTWSRSCFHHPPLSKTAGAKKKVS